jgi:hypothetical protein
MRRSRLATPWCVAALALAVVGGCGGGGGSGGSDQANQAPPAAPLSDSVIVEVPLAYHESVVQLAHAGADFLYRAATVRGMTSSSEACQNGGTADVTLTDNDANGTTSAGDRIDVDLRACYVPAYNGVATGRFSVSILASSGPGALTTSLTFHPGFDLEGVEVRGSIIVSAVRTAARWQLRITPTTANDLSLSFVEEGFRYVERLRSPDIEKLIDYDRARVSNTANLTVDSDLLGGRVSIRTDPVVVSVLNGVPIQGAWKVSLPGVEAVFRGDNEVFPFGLRVLITSAQNGRVIDMVSSWLAVVDGNLWWDPLTWPDVRHGYATNPASGREFWRIHAGPITSVRANASVSQIFSQEIDPSSLATYTFYSGDPGRGPDVPADVVVNGARVTFTARQQLVHGLHYELRSTAEPTVVRSLSGATVANNPMSINVRANLSAQPVASALVALAGQTIQLDGSGSADTDGPIVSHRWRQLSGTPAAIANPDASITRIDLAATGTPELATFELEVRNAEGEYARKRIDITIFPNLASRQVLYVRGTGGFVFGNRIDAFSPLNGTLSVTRNPAQGIEVSFSGDGVHSSSRFRLSTAAATNVPLGIGAYDDARTFGNSNGQPGFAFSGDGSSCNVDLGRFVVHDVAYDVAGEVTRLALDFDHGCNSLTPTVFGSIRFNSTVPLRQ